MTNEEREDAIRFFEWVAKDESMNYSRLAIEALKAQEVKHDEKVHQEQGESAEFGAKTGKTCTDAISRQAAIDALTEYGNGRAVYIGVEEAVRRIEQLPSAQPEIIRCKDCKYHRQNYHGDSWCAHPKGLDQFDLKPTDFCSRGEWKEDENNKQN